MPSSFEIRKFESDRYEEWAPAVASFIADNDPLALPEAYEDSPAFEHSEDAAHYGYFVNDAIVAVAGLHESHFDHYLDKHLYFLVGEPGYEDPKSALLGHVEREIHMDNFPMVTALVNTAEYRFYRRHGYRPRKVAPEDMPPQGQLYVCKYIWVGQVARVRFSRSWPA